MKHIKHSKYRNTAILFELLVRQITLEVLNGDTTENAKHIVRKYFAPVTELNKELRLYEMLLKGRYNTVAKAEKFVDMVMEVRNKMDDAKLLKEKYNLIKELSGKFEINQFLASPVSDYKVMASVYKMFESQNVPDFDIKETFDAKQCIVESIASKAAKSAKPNENAQLIETYEKQEKDLRMLTYKILVDTFNKKYTNLNIKQKGLLREYINNITNTSKFKDYVVDELPKIKKELKQLNAKLTDKVTKIKLTETIIVLDKMKIGKNITDNQVSSLMLSYELIKELKTKVKWKNQNYGS